MSSLLYHREGGSEEEKKEGTSDTKVLPHGWAQSRLIDSLFGNGLGKALSQKGNTRDENNNEVLQLCGLHCFPKRFLSMLSMAAYEDLGVGWSGNMEVSMGRSS